MQRTLIKDTVGAVDKEVLVSGWVNTRRDLGKIVFLDLRDRTGLLQVVGGPKELDEASREVLKEVRPEFVLQIRGVVQQRGEKQVNPDLPTGRIELSAREIKILNPAKTPPFEISNEDLRANEELRLKYRYLDLRHERMQKNLDLRHRVVKFLRDYLNAEGFIEVETPILTKGTPEGAREFLVPSRLYPGQFYVLPQSPQQFKQLLMVAGLERYFQIARCFRDEDQRGDRQPEFTQLDLEMSFVSQEDILDFTEKMFTKLIEQAAPRHHPTASPWPRLTYAEARKRYGTDKPDLRKNKNDPRELAFVWIVDFPLFEKDSQAALTPTHHPFTRPHPEDEPLLEAAPLKVRAWAYDFVCNGYELSSGSIRIHERPLQNKIFKILGLSDQEIQERFGHLLEAFEYGAPPHGGIAPGIDRLVMILAGEPNIREVIVFPKTSDARDLMMGAPSAVDEKALEEAHIQIK